MTGSAPVTVTVALRRPAQAVMPRSYSTSMAREPRSANVTCDVWVASGPSEGLDQTVLDSAERDRLDAVQHDPIEHDQFLLGALLLRHVLAVRSGVPVERVTVTRSCPRCAQPHGKPTVPGTPWGVSVSHANDLVVVACDRVAGIGVDIEPLDTEWDRQAVAPLTLDHVERQALLDLPPAERPDRVLRTWVCKEAVLKLSGDGLALAPTSLRIDWTTGLPGLVVHGERPDLVGRVSLALVDVAPGHVCAVARADADHACANPVVVRDGGMLLRRQRRR